MSLETRVDTLEHDVALLRAETRGWAAIAIAADRKSEMNAELLNLIYRDVSEMKTTLTPDVATLKTDVSELKTEVAAHGSILREHTGTLREHGDILREHGDILREHGEMLREHGEMLREILARLA
jgi:hypothetical protein